MATGLVLAACGAGTHAAGGMMGGPSATSRPMGMGNASVYRYSTLTCAASSNLPGSVVTVMLGDMGMSRMMRGTAPRGAHMMLRAAPTTVRAGQVSFVVKNMGWRTHELVVLPLAPGTSAGQRVPGADGKVSEAGSLGEASKTCGAGAGDGIAGGTTGWVTMTLPAGHYELVCNLPNHYADGMHQELTVPVT